VSVRYWSVAGGVLEDERGLVLVANRRRDGRIDWTTPGGVVDDGETAIQALRREVHEETGLSVDRFDRRLWTVEVEFVDLEMHLEVEVHRAASWTGEIVVADPDGIVIDVEFVSRLTAEHRLRTSAEWVAEPLREWLAAPWVEERVFGYRATGTDPASIQAVRVS
jgi:8-oxo-dGTP diphosphatase